MPKSAQNSPATPQSQALFLTAVMSGFFLLGAVTLFHHEMWRDELQTWMTVKHSHSFSELIENKKYDGHPILWYLFPYFASKFTGDPLPMQVFHLLFAAGTVWLFTRYSPFSRLQKVLFAFGYFAVYEYAVITRNYAIGLLFLFLFLAFYDPRRRPGWVLPCLLAVGAQANAFSLMLAVWLGAIYYVFLFYTRRGGPAFSGKEVILLLVGAAVFLGSVWLSLMQLAPPPGSWVEPLYLSANAMQAKKVLGTLWCSYVPIPGNAMHFWNTNIIASVDTQAILSIGLFLLFLLSFIRKPLIALSYVAVTLGFMFFFYARYFGYMRHHGHLFIVLVMCFWLYYDYSKHDIPSRSSEKKTTLLCRASIHCFTLVLVLQVVAGLYACASDWKYPFSASKKTAEYLVEQGLAQKPMVGCVDYVASAVASRLDTPVYFPQNGRLGTYLIFDGEREEFWREYGWVNQRSVSIILQRSYEYMLNKKEDVVLLLSFPLARTQYPIVPVKAFTESVVEDEVYFLYLMQYPKTSQ